MDSSEKKPILFSYFRSSASWRVRIALAWKNVDYDYKPVNLLTHANLEDEYRQINPTGKIPAFITPEGETLAQSQAIMEYLEETFPERPVLPKSAVKRAEVREICQVIACDIHPLQNLGVLQRIAGDDMERKVEWAKTTVTLGFKGLEKRLEKLSGKYCVGDTVTMADFFLVPMVGNANRWNVDMSQFPIISRINNDLMALPEFIAASPPKQPDCPEDLRK